MPKIPKKTPSTPPSRARIIVPTTIATLGILLALSANIANRINSIKPKGTQDNTALIASPDNLTSPPPNPNIGPNPDPPNKFEPETYTPPVEGEIIESHIVPGSPQTIIYITDEHPIPGASEESNATGRLTQELIIKIVQDLMQKYGPIRLVAEESLIGITSETLKNLSNTGDPTIDCIGRIARQTTEKNRESQLETCLSTPFTLAASALTAAYPKEIIPIGVNTYEQTQQTLMIADDYGYAATVLTHPQEFDCLTEGLTLADATQAFTAGDLRPEITDCYCSVQVNSTAAIRTFEQDRAITSPEREIGAALAEVPANGITVVIAGENHLAHSRELMHAQGVNHIIVAPRNIVAPSRSRLNAPIFEQVPTLADDSSRTCANWQTAELARQQQAQQDVFLEWFMEE